MHRTLEARRNLFNELVGKFAKSLPSRTRGGLAHGFLGGKRVSVIVEQLASLGGLATASASESPARFGPMAGPNPISRSLPKPRTWLGP